MTAVSELVCPFRGLNAFSESDLDALMFFGRARETEVIAANMQAARLTVLYGPSGVGKSSILRAGVARRLREEHDAVVVVLDAWSGDPAASFERARTSATADQDLYVILDQFEEYFVYHADDDRLPRSLAEVVADRGARVNVLIGIRDDALAQLDSFRTPVPHLLGNRLRLDRLGRESARQAILGPIARYNELTGESVSVEPQLVDAVLGEVSVERDRIETPFLQLVLERLWFADRERGNQEIRVETLRALGGAAHIVHDHLERAMRDLTRDEQRTAAAMYDRLVTPSGTKISQRAGDLARYASVDEPDATAVLEKLARERIVRPTSSNGVASTRFEIYHDVLAGAIRDWLGRHETEQRVEAAERRRRRAVAIATAALVALLVVAAIAIFALIERRHAKTEASHARAGELVAQARSDLEVDPTASLTAALAATQRERSPQVEAVLRDALIASRLRGVLRSRDPVVAVGPAFAVVGDATGRVRKIDGDGNVLETQILPTAVTSVAVGPSGSYAAGSRDGTILERRASGVGHRQVGEAPVTALALARDTTAVGTANGKVSVLGEFEPKLAVKVRGRVQSLSFSPGGKLVLIVSRDRRAEIADVRTGEIVQTLTQRGYINAAAFDPTGRTVATASADRSARLWSTATGRPVHTFRGATESLTAVSFQANGKLVAFASSDGVARVYDVRSGALRFYLSGDTKAITDIDFDPSGRALVTSSADRSVRIWTTDVGRLLSVLHGHGGAVTTAAFMDEGRRVVTTGTDSTVRIWDSAVEPELRPIAHHDVPFSAASRRPDGTIVIVDKMRHGVVLDAGADRIRERVAHADVPLPTSAVAGGVSAHVDASGVVHLRRRGQTRQLDANANAVALSPDGAVAAAGCRDGYLRVWSTATGRLLYAVVAHQGPVADVAFSPDGRWIVTAGPISAGVWNASTGQQLLLLRGPTKPVRAALFTSDGRKIVTASDDRTIRSYQCVVCGTFDQLVSTAKSVLTRVTKRSSRQ